MQKPIRHIFLLSISMLITACGLGVNTENSNSDLKSIVIFVPEGYKEPLIDDSFPLKAEGVYSQIKSEDITARVSWQSNDDTVATISSSGIVKILASGEVVITASFSGFTDFTSLIIESPTNFEFVSISQLVNGYVVDEGQELQLSTLVVLSGAEEEGDNRLFNWVSSNDEVAQVDEDGNIMGVRYGTADITATVKGNPTINAAITLTVNPIVTGLSFSRSTTYSTPGQFIDDFIVNQSFSDGLSQPAPTLVQWNYVPSGIAEISRTGKLDSFALGTTTATATYGNFQLEHEIVVESPASLFVVNDNNGFVTVSWDPKRDATAYTLCWNKTENCTENDSKNEIVFGPETNEFANTTFVHAISTNTPYYYRLAFTRQDQSPVFGEEITVWPRVGAWQNQTEIEPNVFSAGAAIREKMYVIGGESIATTVVSKKLWEYNMLTNKWNNEAFLNVPLKNAAACAIGDFVYIIGGENSDNEIVDSIHRYHTINNTWEFDKTFLPYPLRNVSCDVADDMIYITGGFNGTEAVANAYRYDPENDSWKTLPTLNTARYNHASQVLNEVIYVAGGTTKIADGSESVAEVTGQVESLDLAVGASLWLPLAAMETPRSDFALQAWSGNLRAIGGIDNNNNALINTIETYDLTLNSWQPTITMPHENAGFLSTLYNGSLYTFGGNESARQASDDQSRFTQYDINTGSWTSAPSISDAREAFSTVMMNEELYVIGGSSPDSGVTRDVRIYNTETNSWRKTSPLNVSRSAATAVAIKQGSSEKIYVLGGHNSFPLNHVEVYDLETKNWESLSRMNVRRSQAATAAIGSKIFVFGGSSSSARDTYEMYDIETDTWQNLGDMDKSRSQASAVALNDKIYLIGGLVNGGTSNIVDIYTPSSNSWETNTSTLNYARKRAGSAVLNNRIYVFGGLDISNTPVRSVETYSAFSTNKDTPPVWTNDVSLELPELANLLQGGSFQNKITLVGERKTSTTLHNDIYILE